MVVQYSFVNLLTLLLGAVFLIHSYHMVRKGREDIPLFLLSSVLGVGLVLVALLPNIFEIIGGLLGLELKARAILVTSNLVLFVVAMYLLGKVGELNWKVSRLNAELSLTRAEREEEGDED